MAFNFNWSPLIADTILARDLLTTALNKTPKPPIIVDDIIVTELNLGSTPPDLTLLEVGDLAQDRFRGVFKVTYGGDAFLTLRTRVQANPLNTELQKRRRMGARGGVGWCEPDCLAADSGLTIPVAITLSDFVLSGFVILVFSRSKGLTLVFRNDPLESLKVSSTFDSIPFVRDYLQRTIEERLRALFMEDLPAILHRLSLRLWGEEGQKQTPLVGDGLTDQEPEIAAINPLASPAQEPITCSPGDIEEIAHMMALAMDASAETESTFSQKNLLKLASLADSQRTLSLTTPAPRDVMFRAWATMADRVLSQEQLPISLQHLGILSRRGSALGSSYSSRNSVSADSESLASGSVDHRSYLSDRPSLNRTATSSSYIGLSERHRHSHHPQRKRKHRVINLRRTTTNDTVMPDDSHHNDTHGASSTSVTVANSPTEETATNSIAEEMLDTPRASTRRRDASNNLTPGTTPIHSNPGSTRKSSAFARLHGTEAAIDLPGTAPPAYPGTSSPQLASTTKDVKTPVPSEKRPIAIKSDSSHHPYFTAPLVPLLRSLSEERFDAFSSSDGASTAAGGGSWAVGKDPSFGGGVLEQAWLQKMKRETALRVRDEKRRRAKMEKMEGEREAEEVEGPPAYVE